MGRLFTEDDSAFGERGRGEGEGEHGGEQQGVDDSQALAPDKAVVTFVGGSGVIVGCGHG